VTAIPLALTILRLLLGPVAILLALTHSPRLSFAPLLLLGFLSDIFDGVLARRFGVAWPWLRRFDSLTDVIYYLCIFGATCLVARPVLREGLVGIALLFGSEVICHLVSWTRFRTMPATHCFSAKVYGIFLFLTFVGVLAFQTGAWVLIVLTIVGLVANAEVVAVLLLSTHPPIDVPGVFTLWRPRRRV